MININNEYMADSIFHIKYHNTDCHVIMDQDCYVLVHNTAYALGLSEENIYTETTHWPPKVLKAFWSHNL